MEKTIRATLVVTRIKRDERHESTYTVCTDFSERTTVGDVADFIDGMKKIWTTAVNAAKRGDALNMDISAAVYSRGDGGVLKTESYNRWYVRNADDVSTERGEEGIYLVPDTRYTEESRDMFLSRDILRDMAFV